MSNDKAAIYYESGQNAQALSLMTTTDDILFKANYAPFSKKSGFDVSIMPNGLVNGGTLSPSAAADTVTVEECLVMMAGVSGASENGQLTVSGDDVLCARPGTDTHLIYSITVDNSGDLVAVVGSESTSFSETRGVAGGPPFIPVDSIEIGQVRYATQTSGVVVANEIKQVPGLHQELADQPIYEIDYAKGEVSFADELPDIHTGGVAKQVHVLGFTPIFAETPRGYDWSPAEESHSTNSQQVYNGAVGSTSSSIGQATFSAILKDGLTDNILKVVNENIWIKFKQDRNRAPYQLTLGKLGLARTFPADGNVGGSFTVSPESKSVDFSS